MKKTLLLGSFAIMAMMANAQTSVVYTSTEYLEGLGFTTDAAQFDAGTVLAEGEAGTIVLSSDQWKIFTPAGSYKNVSVNGVELNLGDGGVTGSNNPSPSTLDSAPESGAFYEITPKEDGWITVFTKMNPNKQYAVFEGKTTAMSYTLGWSNGTDKIYYTLPATEDYALDFNSPEIEKYVNVETMKPHFPWEVAGMEAAPGENTGFVTFNAAGGMTYYFCAYGSKAACGGFVYTADAAQPVVVFEAVEGENPLEAVTFGEGAGVESIAADSNVNAPVYNVMGQKVNDDYKGIVIQNGKKFIRK